MKIPFLDLSVSSSQKKRLLAAVDRTLRSGNFILGKNLEKFEKEFAAFTGTKHAIGVASGTDALRISLRALGVKNGDKVLTVGLTSPFTILAIVEEGAMPVFCEVDEKTLTIDLRDAEGKIDSKTKFIIPVHIFGNPADMKAINNFAKKHSLLVIEDACQAHGAKIGKKYAGSFGDAAAFSFYPTKNLGALGDAGMVTTNNSKTAQKIRILRNGGQTRRFWHTLQGLNSRLDELQAAILSEKLRTLKKENFYRKKLAERYKKALVNLPIRFQENIAGSESANHIFVVLIKDRQKFKDYLAALEIGSDIYYPSLPFEMPAFSIYRLKSLTVTKKIVGEILALPLSAKLSSKQQDEIIGKIKKYYS